MSERGGGAWRAVSGDNSDGTASADRMGIV